MTVEAQVRAAKSPGEALLILAQAIDALEPPPASDPLLSAWSIPFDSGDADFALREAATVEREWDESVARANYNRKLELLGERPSDPEEAAAWDAQRRLLGDDLKPPTPSIGTERSAMTTVPLGKDSHEVRVPKADEATQQHRRQFAHETLLLDAMAWWTTADLALEPADALDAYAKGGPLWLVAYDRNFVLQLPVGVKKALVDDVESFSPDDAQAFGRDILKATDPTEGRGVALGAQAAAQKIAPPEL